MEPLTGDDPGEVAGYELHARLGAGGMGQVYLAFTRGGRPVALKVIRPELGDDQDFRLRFRQEVEAARRVHGLYTAQLIDADADASPPWLVTAYVAGPSMQQAVTDYGPMPAGTVLLLMAGVAEALQAIHAAGVVHRDLKPSNVLLAPDGPRVIDFGIARAAEATAVTRTGIRVGSPQFMAPEQVAGLTVSPAIDVFALGSLAAYAALGRSPFAGDTEAAILYRILHEPADLAGCPPPLRHLVEHCLAKQAADRPAPEAIITECRARAAGTTLEMAGSWLPPAIVAALAQHAVPSASVPSASVPVPTATAPVPTATAPVTELKTASPSGVPALGPGEPGRRRLSRTAVIAGTAAGIALAGLISAGLLPRDGSADVHRGRHQSAGSTSPRKKLAASASARPSQSSTLDPCVIGTWKGTSEDLINNIDNNPVQFTGPGATEIDLPDGTQEMDYGHSTVYTANVNGNQWTDVFRGTATMHYEDLNGMVLISDVSAHGSWELLENGSVTNSGPLSIEPTPYRYTCSGDTMREFFTNGSDELTRKPPITQPGS
jgi:serine/threonine protein kinase